MMGESDQDLRERVKSQINARTADALNITVMGDALRLRAQELSYEGKRVAILLGLAMPGILAEANGLTLCSEVALLPTDTQVVAVASFPDTENLTEQLQERLPDLEHILFG
jgi:hypothetical protein